MNQTRQTYTLLIALCFLSCADQPRPILLDEYDIYAQCIARTVLRRGNDLSGPRQVFVFDSTEDLTIDKHTKSYRETIIVRGGTILYLLDSCPDTFQLAAIDDDYSRNNRRQFAISIDSLRRRLPFSAITIAESLSALPNSSYAIQFSRVAFNSSLDQAMVKMRYTNIFGYTASDAYFVRKKGQWRFVQEVYQRLAKF